MPRPCKYEPSTECERSCFLTGECATRARQPRPPHAAAHEPMPIRNAQPAVQDLVIADMQARKEVGLERYGTLLQAFNGRDSIMDAYQESLDLSVYLRQVMAEDNVLLTAVRDLLDVVDAAGWTNDPRAVRALEVHRAALARRVPARRS